MSSKKWTWKKWRGWKKKKRESPEFSNLPISISSDQVPTTDQNSDRKTNRNSNRFSTPSSAPTTSTSLGSNVLAPIRESEDERVESEEIEEEIPGQENQEEQEEKEWVIMEVSVEDTGIGIDPSIVSQLFRPYAQAAVSTMREYLFSFFIQYI